MADKAAVLTRDDLLSGDNFRTNEVLIGGKRLRLRELTAEEWMQLSKDEREQAEKTKAAGDDVPAATDTLSGHFDRVAVLICKTAVDENGARLFTPEDAPLVKSKLGAATLMEVYRTLARLGQEGPGMGGA